MGDEPTEFWQEESARDRQDMRRVVVRWVLALLVLLAGLGFALWYSMSAVSDDESGRGQFFEATADIHGDYDLMTLAEPHAMRFTANGYKPLTQPVGKPWYSWMPSGEQKLDVNLEPEQ